MITRPLVLLSIACVVGCDQEARPGVASAGPVPAQRLSGEHESCVSTAHCQDGLRCLEQVCRDGRASIQGDFHAAVAERALEEGDLARAIEGYRAAEVEYRAEGFEELPAAHQCSFGRALASERTDLLLAEEAASRLHRCLGAAPVGSALRARALAGLALLEAVGFDPAHLGGPRADRYLTRAPTAPPVTELELAVTADRQSRARSFTQLLELARSAEVKEKLVPCWEGHWRATRQTKMAVEIPVRHTYRLDEYDYFDRAVFEVEEYEAPADEALREATRCVEQVLGPLGDDLARRLGSESRWSAKLSIVVGG
jgi:hypothetical protein